MQASIKKIILATDFSDTSKEASYYALLLAHAFKAELKALHVFDTSAWNVPFHDYSSLEELGINRVVEGFEETRQRGKNALKELAESFDLEVETIFTEGKPGHEIVRVAEFVGRHAPCAVFTIRPREK